MRSSAQVWAVAAALAAPAGAEPALPWLSNALEAPPGEAAPLVGRGEITVAPLGAPDAGAVGLISADRAGLPADLWGGADAGALAARLRALPIQTMPALQELTQLVLLVETPPPPGGGAGHLAARVDALLRRGALEPAKALLERAGPETPALFLRWFDISLLDGTEQRGCATLAARPDLSPSLPVRVFCLARSGRWATAALTLETSFALGAIDEAGYGRLAHFLDPELYEGAPAGPWPDPMTPLDFRLLEAVGEPLPTGPLPIAFAQTDLRHIVGWKAQIEAAERLARAGALAPNRLLGLYTARRPAASGGVWDRAAAIRALDIALTAGRAEAVAATLPAAEMVMAEAGLTAVLAEIFGPRLARLGLADGPGDRALRLALIADPAQALRAPTPATLAPTTAFARALAAGEARPAAPDARAARLAAALDQPGARPVPAGPALLDALETLANGPGADSDDAAAALAAIAAAGRADLARAAAVQLILAEPEA